MLITRRLNCRCACISCRVWFWLHTEKTRRKAAATWLLKLAENQEKYYLINNAYGYAYDVANTEKANYTLPSVIDATGSTYILTATAAADGVQASDSICNLVTYNSVGQKNRR